MSIMPGGVTLRPSRESGFYLPPPTKTQRVFEYSEWGIYVS